MWAASYTQWRLHLLFLHRPSLHCMEVNELLSDPNSRHCQENLVRTFLRALPFTYEEHGNDTVWSDTFTKAGTHPVHSGEGRRLGRASTYAHLELFRDFPAALSHAHSDIFLIFYWEVGRKSSRKFPKQHLQTFVFSLLKKFREKKAVEYFVRFYVLILYPCVAVYPCSPQWS